MRRACLPPMEIRTGRLLLRSFREEDITPEYISWLCDPNVVRFSNQRFLSHDRESALRYLQSFQGTANDFLSIEMLEDGWRVGTMTVYRNAHHGTCDIGIMVGDRGVWGSGIGGEAWCATVGQVIREPGVRKVTGGTLRPNLAMVRIFERSGMHLEAVRAGQELLNGEPVDVLLYARFRSGD